jgi:pimeloyl-ACP methyl ester carboxylesterase
MAWKGHAQTTEEPVIAERLIDVNGVGPCTESFGDPADPPILLVMGLGGSMLWWPDEFCRLLAEPGRFVIRYDQRDTGRSTTYEPGHPGYTGADLPADAIALLDGYALPAAHLVGVSSGGALVQLLVLDLPSRVLSLVLISASPTVPGDRSLPPPSAAFTEFARSATVDWSNAAPVIDYLVAYARVLAGEQRRFDEAEARDFVRPDLERARDVAALQNHNLLDHDDRPRKPLSTIEAPTLVIHGTADPMFPLRHGHRARRRDPERPAAPARRSRPRRPASRLGQDHGGHCKPHRRLVARRADPGLARMTPCENPESVEGERLEFSEPSSPGRPSESTC